VQFVNSIAFFFLTESALRDYLDDAWLVKVLIEEPDMAKVAKPSSHRIVSGPLKSGPMVKKKTPSELRVGC